MSTIYFQTEREKLKELQITKLKNQQIIFINGGLIHLLINVRG